MQIKDFYKSLGVDEKAGADEIKKAYRQLAKKYHPDANPNDKAAEDRFKDISEAYDVLSDPQKRKKYDQLRTYGAQGSGGWINFDPEIFRQRGGFHGPANFNGQGFSFSDVLRDLFGIDNLFGEMPSVPGSMGSQAELRISFEEAMSGAQKTLTLRQQRRCVSCGGTGHTGRSICSHCAGSGLTVSSQKVRVNVPAGVDDGQVISLPNLGRHPPFGNSDLMLTIRVEPHNFFQRRGNDIYCQVILNDETLNKGTKIRVKTIDGRKVELRIPPGTKAGTTFRLKDLGLKRSGIQGHQYVRVV